LVVAVAVVLITVADTVMVVSVVAAVVLFTMPVHIQIDQVLDMQAMEADIH
jgi:hypothetical protein